jgi:hypothetical protein
VGLTDVDAALFAVEEPDLPAGLRAGTGLDIPRSYLSRGSGKFVGEEVAELVGEAVGVGTA